jgi:hypothetical protein
MIRHSSRLTLGLALAVLGLSLAHPLAAQTTLADPNDPLYADIDAWATKGLLKNLPRLRPYTMTMTLGLLKDVAATGSVEDVAEAQRYIAILGDHAVHPRADVRADAALSSSSGNKDAVMAAPGLALNSLIGDHLGLSARMDVWLTHGTDVSSLTPDGQAYDRDLLYGSGSGLGGSTQVCQDLVGDTTYGDENLGVQAGYMRGSWGPVYDDGVVIGPQAPESGQLTFSWRSPTLTFDAGFFMLQQGWSTSSSILDDKGDSVGFNSQKYLMIHGLNWAPNGWLELGAFESIVWVDRMEPLYFIPLSEYFFSQSFSGYSDNSFAGLSASFYLPYSTKLDLVTYIDDLAFASIIKGDWDTDCKIAFQAALSWAPESPIVQRVSLDYTAVTPYTYTHWADTGSDASGNSYVGALAYTNAGQNIGPDLEPDSDRITLQAKSRTIDGVQVSGILRLIRHGNASSGVNGYNDSTSASGDASGDLGDPGTFNSSTNGGTWIFSGPYNTGTWPLYLRFLTQSVLQITMQAGFGVDFTRYIDNLGTLNAGFGYTFEYIANDGCVSGVSSLNNYLSFNVGLAL